MHKSKELYLIANWKMNPAFFNEAENLASRISKGARKIKNVKVVICPSFPYLKAVSRKVKTGVALGAQNCHFEDKGAYTGEVSAPILRDSGCSFVIVGHSERRKYAGETDDVVNKKAKAVLRSTMRPIIAIGEKKQEDNAEDIVENQLSAVLKDINSEAIGATIIAYEPVWAIGTGNAATPEYVLSMRAHIKKILQNLYSEKIANTIPILYGGSTNHKNISLFIEEAQMDGALVGGSSLDAEFSS